MSVGHGSGPPDAPETVEAPVGDLASEPAAGAAGGGRSGWRVIASRTDERVINDRGAITFRATPAWIS